VPFLAFLNHNRATSGIEIYCWSSPNDRATLRLAYMENRLSLVTVPVPADSDVSPADLLRGIARFVENSAIAATL
jgi:hypothetical protein